MENSLFFRIIRNFWIDKTIALVAVSPFIYLGYKSLTNPDHPLFYTVLYSIMNLTLIITMVLRRPAARVTHNPYYWLLSFTATYGVFAPLFFSLRMHPLVSEITANGVLLLGAAITMYARFSLGFNMGFVPAQRELVTKGAYRFVRHPVYTGIFICHCSALLRHYSNLFLGMELAICLLFVVKTFAEENFLRQDEQYRLYMQRTRYRFIPYIV